MHSPELNCYVCYKGDQEKEKKKKGKREMPEFFADVSISSICTFYLLYYTHDLHILPSKEITMMETSSW
jgi:hypothetical protein